MKTIKFVSVIMLMGMAASCGRSPAASKDPNIENPTPVVPTDPTDGQEPTQPQVDQRLLSSPLGFYGQIINESSKNNYFPWDSQKIQQNRIQTSQDFSQPLRIGTMMVQLPQNMHVLSTASTMQNGQYGQSSGISWTRADTLGGPNVEFDSCRNADNNSYAAIANGSQQGGWGRNNNSLNLVYCRTQASESDLANFGFQILAPNHVMFGSNDVWSSNQGGSAQSRLLLNMHTGASSNGTEFQRLCGSSAQQISANNLPNEMRQVMQMAGNMQQAQVYHCQISQDQVLGGSSGSYGQGPSYHVYAMMTAVQGMPGNNFPGNGNNGNGGWNPNQGGNNGGWNQNPNQGNGGWNPNQGGQMPGNGNGGWNPNGGMPNNGQMPGGWNPNQGQGQGGWSQGPQQGMRSGRGPQGAGYEQQQQQGPIMEIVLTVPSR